MAIVLRRRSTTPSAFTALAALTVAAIGGWDRIDVVTHSQIQSAHADWSTRAAATACLALGGALLVRFLVDLVPRALGIDRSTVDCPDSLVLGNCSHRTDDRTISTIQTTSPEEPAHVATSPHASTFTRVAAGSGRLRSPACSTLGAPPALAHVGTDKDEVAAGASTTLTFSIGHGCEESPTTSMRFQIPESVLNAAPVVKPGWTIEVEKQDLATPVEAGHGEQQTDRTAIITFTAQDGYAVDSGFRDNFTLAFAAPEAEGPLFFKVIQGCEAGENAWIDEWDGTGDEPEHPAPSVMVVAGSADEGSDRHAAPRRRATTTARTVWRSSPSSSVRWAWPSAWRQSSAAAPHPRPMSDVPAPGASTAATAMAAEDGATIASAARRESPKRSTRTTVSSLLPCGRRLRLSTRIESANCSTGCAPSVSSSCTTSLDRHRLIARCIGQTVGVQHHRVAGRDIDDHVAQLRLDDAQQGAELADLFDRPVGAPQQGLADGRPVTIVICWRAARPGFDVDEAHGAERRRSMVGHRPVERVQHVGRRSEVPSRGTQGVPRQAGDRRGLDALAAHVADDDRPPTLVHLEHVVEVATDQAGRACRPVASGDLAARRWFELLRQQAQLQRLGDLALLVVQPLVVAGQTDRLVVSHDQPAAEPGDDDGRQHRRSRRPSTTGARTAHC